MDDASIEIPRRRRLDGMSAVMSGVTVAVLIGSAWLRFGPATSPEPPAATVGAEAPLLRLHDVKTSEPLMLVGLRGRVVWVVFWSTEAASGRSCLPELEAAWKDLKAHPRFALVTAAIQADDPGRVRATV